MEHVLLTDFVTVFALALVVLFVCHRVRIPTIVGFLLTGVVVGPHGLRLVHVVHEADLLAEIGVVLLLFTIGIEFSLEALWSMRPTVIIGGGIQVLLTLAVGAVVGVATGRPWGQALFIGCFIALSSTAIVLKLLQERAETASPHGRASVGILIFQDIAVVPMVLLIPLLAGQMQDVVWSVAALTGKAAVVVVVTVVAARWLVPKVLYQAARLRDREVFLLSVVVIGLGIAWLTANVGLSLALGAFLAGLIISESEYSHRALGDILPFRDLLTSFFFISVGMLLDIGYVLRNPVWLLVLALGVMVVKSLTAGLAMLALGQPLRIAVLTAVALSQVGEFSFVLLKEGLDIGLLGQEIYQTLIAVCVLTMLATPFAIGAAPRLADWAGRLPVGRRLALTQQPAPAGRLAPSDHLVIVGFGLNGQNVARAASAAGIPYIIVEMNPQTVRRMKAAGEPIFYGDATQEAVLRHAGVGEARVLVVAISDAAATRRTVELARRLNPSVQIIARTRFVTETEPLYQMGADEVVPEEFETSIEIFTRVLMRYMVPTDQIDRFSADVRADGYRMFRSASQASLASPAFRVPIPDVEVATVRVAGDAAVVGRSLAELDFRNAFGVTVLAVRRDSQVIANPGGDVRLRAGDQLVVIAAPDRIPALAMHCQTPRESTA